MKKYFKFIIGLFSAAIILLNIWFIINLNGSYKYEVGVNNIDLILKNVWINYELTKWILGINSFYILLIAFFMISKSNKIL